MYTWEDRLVEQEAEIRNVRFFDVCNIMTDADVESLSGLPKVPFCVSVF